jgi:hypothetical protein
MLCSMAKYWGRQMRAAVHFAATATIASVLTGPAIVVAFCCFLATPGMATTFVFDETSSSVPGFVVTSSITVNNTFTDLPAVTNVNNNGPYPFDDDYPLQAFSITVPGGQGTYILSDFTPEILSLASRNGASLPTASSFSTNLIRAISSSEALVR